MRSHHRRAILLACLLCSAPAFAAETEVLDEMVVTATRTPKSEANAPAVVDVIDTEDMERYAHQSTVELLTNEAGVMVQQPQGEGIVTPEVIRMRGLSGSERVLVLLDGQMFNGGFAGYAYLSQMPTEAVERIEVVRGAFSSLYGSHAMSGVMQFFTDDGSNETFHGALGYKGGDFGRHEYALELGGSHEDVSLAVSASDYASDNYYLNDHPPVKNGAPVLDLTNRGHEHSRAHAHARWQPSPELDLHLSGGYFRGKTGFGRGMYHLPVDQETEVETGYVNARGTWTPNDLADVFFGVDYLDDSNIYTGESLVKPYPFSDPEHGFSTAHSENRTEFDRLHAGLGTTLYLGDANLLTMGTEAYRVEGSKVIVDKQTREVLPVGLRGGEQLEETETNASLYLQDDWWFAGGALELILGLRYDDYENFGDEWSPKAALVWHYLPTGRVKFAAGKAYRAPSMSDRISPAWSIAPTVTFVGNPDARSETLLTAELTLENEFADRHITTRLTPFYTEADDFLVAVTRPDPLDPLLSNVIYYDNVAEVRITGVEAEIACRPIPELELFANYQYSAAIDRNTDHILDNHPRNLARGGISWSSIHFADRLGIQASLTGSYTDSQHYTSFGMVNRTGVVPGYTVWDAHLGLDFWHGRISVFADCFNLFDKQTFRSKDTDYLPERNYLAGTRLSWRY